MSEALFQGLVAGGVLGILIVFIKAIISSSRTVYERAKPKIETVIKETKNNYHNISKSTEDKVLEVDDIFYEKANNEVETNSQIQGLWIKAGVLAKGDSSLQKIEYIKLRALQLSKKTT